MGSLVHGAAKAERKQTAVDKTAGINVLIAGNVYPEELTYTEQDHYTTNDVDLLSIKPLHVHLLSLGH